MPVLLQMSFFGTVFIVAVIIIRALAVNRLPKRAFLVLWELVLLRLLIPFSIPSPFSIYTLLEKAPFGAEVRQTNTTVQMLPLNENAVFAAETESWMHSGMPQWTVLQAVWCAGMVIAAAYFIIVYFRCRMEFGMSLPVRNEYVERWLAEHSGRRRISVRQSDRISAPLTYGIVRPVILMPKGTDWENTEQLQYIFMHEYVHIRRFDSAKKIAAAAAYCIHWFNPAVFVMYLLFNRDIELACDEEVVHCFGGQSRSAYARMLISMEESKSGLQPFCNSFSKNAIEERIKAIMKTKKITVFSIILACCIVVGAATAFATSAKPSGEKQLYMPNFMQPYSVVTYDEDLNRTIIEGGDLTKEEIESREDIAEIGLWSDSPEMLIEPNTKVTYDLHGFIQNVYYLIPGTTDEYQLSKPGY